MNLLRLGGVLAGAMLLAPVAASAANAAEISPASVSTPAFAGDDCYYSHWWNGVYHRHVRLVCDGDDYYGGSYYNDGGFRGDRGHEHGNRGGDFNRGGGNFNRGGGNFGGNHSGVVGTNRGGGTTTGGNRGGGTTTGGGNFRGSGGGRH